MDLKSTPINHLGKLALFIIEELSRCKQTSMGGQPSFISDQISLSLLLSFSIILSISVIGLLFRSNPRQPSYFQSFLFSCSCVCYYNISVFRHCCMSVVLSYGLLLVFCLFSRSLSLSLSFSLSLSLSHSLFLSRFSLPIVILTWVAKLRVWIVLAVWPRLPFWSCRSWPAPPSVPLARAFCNLYEFDCAWKVMSLSCLVVSCLAWFTEHDSNKNEHKKATRKTQTNENNATRVLATA